MRILFDSKKIEHKSPFGTIVPKEQCVLHIHIPATVKTTGAVCVLEYQDGTPFQEIPMEFACEQGLYHIWRCAFSLWDTGLFYYYFRITGHTGTFRLFAYGDDTNMEDGGKWQLSCVPNYTTPDWAKGAVIYQVFPDRFAKSGDCDLTGKLQPYHIHEGWDEEVCWQPDEKGCVLNNDFYGGNFQGIMEKLPYIKTFGTKILYLNPICKSFSSHRYDTGDYKTPDPMLGTMEDFAALCRKAHSLDMYVVLDGVFSHTGADSLYFDKYGSFGGKGAFGNPQSAYRDWFTFREDGTYDSWWGFDTLPTVKKLSPAFLEYIITGEDSVVAHWLRAGADGFRLDVADELPNEFMALLKKRVRQLKPDALVMGEVWEDASNKIAYGVRRRYFVDGTLDSVMNYPFRKAILGFVKGCDDGGQFRNIVSTIQEHYPKQVMDCCMNLLGSHDTPRILTALVDDFDGTREELACRRLSEQQLQLAKKRLKMATVLQFTLPGCPSIYYADEAGMEGGKDPFNRRTYPWGREDQSLIRHFRALGALRQSQAALIGEKLEFLRAEGGVLEYCRGNVHVIVNNSDQLQNVPVGEVLLAEGLTEDGLLPEGYCLLSR